MNISVHGNTGRKNAKKPEDEKATGRLHIRCLNQRKAKWEIAAESENISLSKWIKKTLDTAADEISATRHP